MTLYLAKRVGADQTVDESSTIYLGLCDDDGCPHMVDHRDFEVVLDALAGHRDRAHPVTAQEPGPWLTFASPAQVDIAQTVTPNPHMPSPTPRREEAP